MLYVPFRAGGGVLGGVRVHGGGGGSGGGSVGGVGSVPPRYTDPYAETETPATQHVP